VSKSEAIDDITQWSTVSRNVLVADTNLQLLSRGEKLTPLDGECFILPMLIYFDVFYLREMLVRLYSWMQVSVFNSKMW